MTDSTNHDLVLELTLDVPRETVWRCWTEADLLEQWFAPDPFTLTVETMDVRVGGSNLFVFHGPNGEEMRSPGVYLDIVANERLVFTDAYTEAWKPSAKPFMTAEIVLADADGGGTLYTATARHWSTEDRQTHVDMGFHDGWTKAARQLETVARGLERGVL